MNAVLARVLIRLLCAIHVAVLATLALFAPLRHDHWQGVSIGLLMAQASLIAIWLTLGGGLLFVRMLASLVAVAVLACAPGHFHRPGHVDDFWLWYGLFSMAGGATAAPFIMFRARGTQLARPMDGDARLPPEALQFSIRDLGLWMLTAAVALGGFRWITSLTPLEGLPAQREIWLIFVIGTIFAVVAVVAAWAALGTRFAPLRIAACCMVTALAGPTIAALFDRELETFVAPAVTSGAVILTSLLVVRVAGYRLLAAGRRPPALEPAMDGRLQ